MTVPVCAAWFVRVGRTQQISQGGQKVVSGHEAAADVQAIGLQLQHQRRGGIAVGATRAAVGGRRPSLRLLRDGGLRLRLAQGDAPGRATL